MNTIKYCSWYTVWNKETDEFLCSGPAKECAKILGFANANTFLSSIRNCTRRGTMHKYFVLREVVLREDIISGR